MIHEAAKAVGTSAGASDGRRRLRVLLSAYACEPGKGSEPGNGWNWARELSRLEEVWVLTRENNRRAIEKALEAEPLTNLHFIYTDLPRWARFWKKGSRGQRAYYYLWQIIAYRSARRLHREVELDLIHHVSFATYVVPSFLVWLPIPLIWGPVGGAEAAPYDLAKSFGLHRFVEECVRDLRRRLGEWDPFVRFTAQKAALILAATRQTQDRFAALGRNDARIVAEVALSDEDLFVLGGVRRRSDGPFRVLSIGRLVQFKALDLGLRAFARLLREHPDSEYWLLGEGPERARLAKLAHALGIEGCVKFIGSQSRSEALLTIECCDVMLFPSLHDSGGWAVIEAMAAGRPVVCLDLGGPALRVTEDCGIKIRAHTTTQVVDDLAAALIRLAADQGLRNRMGEAARLRAQTHCRWSGTVRMVDEAYHRLLDGAARKERAIASCGSDTNGADFHQPLSPVEKSAGEQVRDPLAS